MRNSNILISLITASIPGKHWAIGSVEFFQGRVHDAHCTQESASMFVTAPLINNEFKEYHRCIISL